MAGTPPRPSSAGSPTQRAFAQWGDRLQQKVVAQHGAFVARVEAKAATPVRGQQLAEATARAGERALSLLDGAVEQLEGAVVRLAGLERASLEPGASSKSAPDRPPGLDARIAQLRAELAALPSSDAGESQPAEAAQHATRSAVQLLLAAAARLSEAQSQLLEASGRGSAPAAALLAEAAQRAAQQTSQLLADAETQLEEGKFRALDARIAHLRVRVSTPSADRAPPEPLGPPRAEAPQRAAAQAAQQLLEAQAQLQSAAARLSKEAAPDDEAPSPELTPSRDHNDARSQPSVDDRLLELDARIAQLRGNVVTPPEGELVSPRELRSFSAGSTESTRSATSSTSSSLGSALATVRPPPHYRARSPFVSPCAFLEVAGGVRCGQSAHLYSAVAAATAMQARRRGGVQENARTAVKFVNRALQAVASKTSSQSSARTRGQRLWWGQGRPPPQTFA